MMVDFTVAICSYNRCQNLPKLIRALRQQSAPISFEILVVDNNSNDSTQEVLAKLASEKGAPLRYVCEKVQGISHARNRAIEECLTDNYMAFIDDDELPQEGFISSAYHALNDEEADCVGGAVEVALSKEERPKWLVKELLGFLAEVDHGSDAFWIKERLTPIWTCNIAYNMTLFRNNPNLRFDTRFNREGKDIGGGEDAVMFWNLLENEVRIRYRPDMKVSHFVEKWRLKRTYFLRLHFIAGRRFGQFKAPAYSRTFLGIPPFMFYNLLRDCYKAFKLLIFLKPCVRQLMNVTYNIGMIWGMFLSRKKIK